MAACAWCNNDGASKAFICSRCDDWKFNVCHEICQKAFWKHHKKSVAHTERELSRKMAEEFYDYYYVLIRPSSPLAYEVQGAWNTLTLTRNLKKEAFVAALSVGRLPQWFEEQVRKVGPINRFMRTLLEGDNFERIEWEDWDVVMNMAKRADDEIQKQNSEADDATGQKLLTKACVWCKKAGVSKGFKCSRCNDWKFDVCNKVCQKALWKQHKETLAHTDRELSRKTALDFYDDLEDCLCEDFYPLQSCERVYGIRKDGGPKVALGILSRPLGNVVFDAWKTLRLTGQLKSEPFVAALSVDQLPQWFEEQVRKAGPVNGYMRTLLEGNHLKRIEWEDWDAVMLKVKKDLESQADDATNNKALGKTRPWEN